MPQRPILSIGFLTASAVLACSLAFAAACDGSGIAGPEQDTASDTSGDSTPVVSCGSQADCDGKFDLCNGPVACTGGRCVQDTAQAVSCQASPNACIDNICQPDTGACKSVKRAAGESCSDDTDPCTIEACDDNAFCVVIGTSGEAGCSQSCTIDEDCDNKDACTIDRCGPTGTCIHETPPEVCDNLVDDDCDGSTDCDDDACADDASCLTGQCTTQAPITCGDELAGLDGTSAAMANYDCIGAEVPNLKGIEVIVPYTADADENVRLLVDAAPSDKVWLMRLDDTCNPTNCTFAYKLTKNASFTFPVKAGKTSYFVVDTEAAGAVEVKKMELTCSEPEVCDDKIDNDWNGATDCGDSVCASAGPPCEAAEVSCGDKFDNDGDGKTDCGDSDCYTDEACIVTTTELICNDKIDNDNDFATDCQDPDCSSDPACEGNLCQVPTFPMNCNGFPTWGEAWQSFASDWSTCGSATEHTGPEMMLTFTSTVTGNARLSGYFEAWAFTGMTIFLMEGGCSDLQCVSATPLALPQNGEFGQIVSNGFAVEEGKSYTIVIDSIPEFGGPGFEQWFFVNELMLECSGGEICDNKEDDDWDQLVDCLDPDCADFGLPCSDVEICDDDFDNDGDELTDCADFDCVAAGPPCESPETTCDDNFDNDNDGKTDCEDTTCFPNPVCQN